jgi:hypothetical protein
MAKGPSPGSLMHQPVGCAKLPSRIARAEDLDMADEHWQTVRVLHEYYASHQDGILNLRDRQGFRQRGLVKRHAYSRTMICC